MCANQMSTTEIKMPRCIQGKTKDHIRNVTIREKAHIKPIINTFLMKKRLSWFGHVQRRDDDNVAKPVLNAV